MYSTINKTFGILFIFLICLIIPSEAHAFYSNMPASVVVGQTDFTSGSANQGVSVGANTLNSPRSVRYDPISKKLFVADTSNNRVLIFNSVPNSNNASADVVIGQPDFLGSSANQGGTAGANTLYSPTMIAISEGRLFIADAGNHRVLIYNSIPTANNQAANIVVGQADFTGNSANQGDLANPQANTLAGSGELGVASEGEKLFITDSGNARVLIYNSIPTTNNASATVVLGQSDFSTRVSNQGGLSSSSLSTPIGILVSGNKLLVGDVPNFRVLVWNSIPTTNKTPADVVIGQRTFTENGNPGFGNVRRPYDFAYDGKRLFIVHDFSAIVSIRNNGIPTTNFVPPDLWLGSVGNLAPKADNFTQPRSVTIAGNKLIVADSLNNHRVLIFDNALPDLSLTRTVTGAPNGKLRFQGTASTKVENQIVKQVEYSVNGTNWVGGFPTDGVFDNATEDYYFDFDPSSNTMADNQGFTMKIRSTHNNDIDTSQPTFHFEPFLSLSPEANASFRDTLPSFRFAIHTERFSDMRENLDHFRILLRKDTEPWQTYLDYIPVDYNLVRLHQDNLRPNLTSTSSGTYEDRFKTVTYGTNNSPITVQAKPVDTSGDTSDKDITAGGKYLKNGSYQWKVQAVDRAGQIQETAIKTFRIGTGQQVTSRVYFPLNITGIGGKNGTVNISTDNPQAITDSSQPYAVSTRWPTFAGIATGGATVTLVLRDMSCSYTTILLCTKVIQTVVNEQSFFRKTIPQALRVGATYEVTASVKDTGDNYNELPPFLITVSPPTE